MNATWPDEFNQGIVNAHIEHVQAKERINLDKQTKRLQATPCVCDDHYWCGRCRDIMLLEHLNALKRPKDKLTKPPYHPRQEKEPPPYCPKCGVPVDGFDPTSGSEPCVDCKQDTPAQPQPEVDKAQQVQPRVNGVPFRCHCKGNVFTRRGLIYTCNACGTKYEGDEVKLTQLQLEKIQLKLERCDWYGWTGNSGQCRERPSCCINGRYVCHEHSKIIQRSDGGTIVSIAQPSPAPQPEKIQLKPGKWVMRNGWLAEIEVKRDGVWYGRFFNCDEGDYWNRWWNENGQYNEDETHPFDIIAPFIKQSSNDLEERAMQYIANLRPYSDNDRSIVQQFADFARQERIRELELLRQRMVENANYNGACICRNRLFELKEINKCRILQKNKI